MIETLGTSRTSPSVVETLVHQLAHEVVQTAVNQGLTPREGGELALRRLTGLGWDREWMQFFGASAIAAQWRATNGGARDPFWEALPKTPTKPVMEAQVRPAEAALLPALPMSASPNATEQSVSDAAEEPTGAIVLSVERLSTPQLADNPRGHGRDDSLSVLAKDIEEFLGFQLTIAGIWTHVGEMRRADVAQLLVESRQRTKSVVDGYRKRRDKLITLLTYYDNDGVDLRALVLTGRITVAQLREIKWSKRAFKSLEATDDDD